MLTQGKCLRNADGARVICVDLDGTLISTDTLLENLLSFLTAFPLRIFLCLSWLLAGRARLKAKLAESASVNVETLPWNRSLIDWLTKQKEKGDRLVLVTAADRTIARQAADHLGLFDEVMASDGSANLKGAAKAAALVERFGKDGFVYAGDSEADLPVWKEAAGAIVVEHGGRLARRVAEITPVIQTFQWRTNRLRAAVKAMRPYQWVKNTLVFVPIFVSGEWGNLPAWGQAGIAFTAFSLIASGTYLFNDLTDIESDRAHPRKKSRPFAAGDLGIIPGVLISAGCVIAGLLLAATQSIIAPALGYLALTLSYTLFLKEKFLLDVMALASLYTLRLYAGGEATGYTVSIWLFSFSMFLFFGLALMKRVTELMLAKNGVLKRRGYGARDLEILSISGICSAFASAVVLALYFEIGQSAQVFSNPRALWLILPMLLYWQLRCWRAVWHGKMHDDPILYAFRDRPSLIVLGTVLVIMILSRFAL